MIHNTPVDTSKHEVLKKHPFHLVDPSPWPFLTSFSILVLGIGAVLHMHHTTRIVFYVGLLMLLSCAFFWWKDVTHEANTPGLHTTPVQRGLRIGMLLFIASEAMFFMTFFWGYFHSAFHVAQSNGGVWPPKNIITIDPFDLPYLNTLLLLLSGTSITWAHHALLDNKKKDFLNGLLMTICLGILFILIQALEYYHAHFSLKDGIYPSTFYLATGFHGVHVIIGVIFLSVCWIRARRDEFSNTHHVGFTSAAWYWHFVDIVWLFLFISIYWWGNGISASSAA